MSIQEAIFYFSDQNFLERLYEIFKTQNNLDPVFMKDIFHC